MGVFTAIGGYLVGAFGPTLGAVIGQILIGVGLMAAGQVIGGMFAPPRSQTSTPQAQATLNQSAGPRIRGYGRAKLGGTRAFFDSKGGILHQIVMAHHGQIDAVEEYFVGDMGVWRDSEGNVDTPLFKGFVSIVGRTGAPGQTAFPGMLAEWPGVWTPDHRLEGIACWYVRFVSPPADQFQAVFPDGYNTPVTARCRLSRVWDPRVGGQDPQVPATWIWSDNPALCILDYLRHPDGYRRSLDDIDVPSFRAFANICDQAVPLASGGTEKRYRLWGIYSLTDDPADVLAKMRATCDAELYQTPEGRIAIRGGVWEAPTVTFGSDQILGHAMEQGNNLFAAFNELKVLYTSPDHDFQTMEATSWVDLADQEKRGPIAAELALDMVPSSSQARRLAKIHIAKANPLWKGRIVTDVTGLDAIGERTQRTVLPELGIDDAFFIDELSISGGLERIELPVMTISEAAYVWNPATEELQAPPLAQETRPDLELPVPVIELVEEDDGMIFLVVAEPTRTDLTLRAEIRAGAGSLWQAMQVDGLEAAFGPAAPGTYQIRVQWRGQQNTAGPWSDPLTEITVV